MKVLPHRQSASGAAARTRRILRAGTALPLLLVGTSVAAQAIVEQSSSDIVVDADSASGTPVAVELATDGGSISATVDTVTATSAAGTRDYVIGLETANGAIEAVFGSVTATGEGEVLGVGAESVGGTIDLTVGTLDVSGAATSGITAHSVDGSITIGAESVIARGTGVDSLGEFYEAVLGTSDNGSVSIDVGHAETFGSAGSAVGAVAGGQVTIVADSAVAHAEGVIVAYAMSAGDATLDLGSVTLTAADGQGVFVQSSGGNATLAVDTIDTGALAEAARVLAAGDIAVTLGDVDAGGGLTATSSTGDVSVVLDGDLVGRTYGGMGLTGQNVSVAMTADSSITTAGSGWNGIFVAAQNSVDIVASQIATAGHDGHAIHINGGPGPVAITSDSISTTGDRADGIFVRSFDDSTGMTGDISIDSGMIDTSGAQAHGIVVAAAADPGYAYRPVSATAGTGALSVTSETIVADGQGGRGIVFDHAGPITLASGSITADLGGIYMWAGSTVDIVSDSVVTRAGPGIVVYGAGDVSLDSGTTRVGADGDTGIYVGTTTGDISIVSDETVTESLTPLYGFTADGILAISSQGGNIAIDSGTVTVSGEYAWGIGASTDGAVTLASGSVTTSGLGGVGIYARGGTGGVTLESGSVTTTGDEAHAIQAVSTSGALAIDSTGTVAVSGNSADGIFADSETGAIAIGAVTVGKSGGLGSAIHADTNGAVQIDAGAVTVTGPGIDPGVRGDGSNMRLEQGGIVVEGGEGAISIAAGSVVIEGEHRYGISARGSGAIDVAVEEVTFASADSAAVIARGGAGDVNLVTGTVTTTGASGVGVVGTATSGNVAIDAGITRVENEGMAGQFTGDAVTGISGGGTVSIASADAFSAALYGSAIVGIGRDVSIVSGRAETTGDGGVAVYGSSSAVGGTVSIDSATIVTSGSGAALYAIAQNGSANVLVGDIAAAADDATGILARATATKVTVDGTVSVGGLALNAVGFGSSEVDINGSVASTNGAAVSVVSQNGIVRIGEGANVTAATAGVVVSGISQLDAGFIQVYNRGTIEGSVGVYLNPLQNTVTPDVVVQNDGVMIGNSGFAVVTGSGNDVFELTNNSHVTGIADLGAGYDILALGFNDGVTEGIGQVAATTNVEHLSLSSGTWRAATGNSRYESIAIDAGSRLIVAQDNGFIAVAAPYIALDGRLDLELTSDSEPGDLSGLVVEGEGSLHLTGPATLLVDDASGLQHTGGTFVDDGELLLTTVYGGDIATSGEGVFELGEGGDFTGNLVNDGRFVFAQAGDYNFFGDFTGTGQLDKHGTGRLTFAGLYGFEGTTSVFGGVVAFTGQLQQDTQLDLAEGTIDLSQVDGGEQTIASLAGTGGTLQLGNTALTVEQSGDTVFAGAITGAGALIKSGEGELDLAGDGSGFTGTGQVDGGTLSVNGDFSNASFVVNSGGTLGGAGTIGHAAVNGGTLAPGNSIGTLTVNGDVAFTAASVFEVEVDPAGNADLLQATGTATLGGAAVEVIAESGIYRPQTDYTILTAAGGVSGQFGSVDVNLAFLDPSLVYSTNAVTLRLTRNNIDFAAYGETSNQTAIAALIESFGYGNALYDATLTLVDTDVVPSFAGLTGEVYPGYAAGMVETAEMLRRQTADRMAAEGAYAWATGLHTDVSGGSGRGQVDLVGKGVAGGFGFGGNGFSASAGLGLLDHDNGAGDFAGGETTFAIGRLAYAGLGGLTVSAGAQMGWVEGDFRRQTSLGTLGGAVAGRVEGDYLQLFGELAYSLPMGGISVEPFAGISHVAVEFDDLAESGAPTALAVAGIDSDVTFADVGVRLTGDAGSGVRPYASAAYRHAWGDRASLATVGFAGTPGTVAIAGAPIAEDAAELSAGLAVTRGNVDLEVGYDGTISNGFDSHGISAGLRVRF